MACALLKECSPTGSWYEIGWLAVHTTCQESKSLKLQPSLYDMFSSCTAVEACETEYCVTAQQNAALILLRDKNVLSVIPVTLKNVLWAVRGYCSARCLWLCQGGA